MDWNYFGRDLAALRRKHQFLQKQVAGSSGFHASYIAALERGRRWPPREDGLLKILDGLGATNDERSALLRSAKLTEVARAISEYAEEFPGASAAMSLLELSPDMSSSEVKAIQILIEGYRFRSYASRRLDM